MPFWSKMGKYAGRAAYRLAGYGIRKLGRAGVKWAARRFFGNVKSSKRAAKTAVVRIPTHVDTDFAFKSNDKYSSIYQFKPFDFSTESENWYASVTASRTYQHYCELFDECRVLGVRYKLTINNGTLSAGSFMSLVSAVDRNYGPEDAAEDMDYIELMNNPAVVKTTFTNQSRGTAWRAAYPRTLLERSTYFDSTIHTTAGSVKYVPGYEKMTGGFRPCILMMLHKGTAISGATTIPVRVECETVLQFRNPKYQEIDENDRSSGLRVSPPVTASRKNTTGLSKTGSSAAEAFSKLSDAEKSALVVEEKDDEIESGAKKFDSLTDEEKAKIMELVGSMEE